METKLDLSWCQAKNTFDKAKEKVGISELLPFDNSYFREEQACTAKIVLCNVVQVEITSLESIKMW